jgi:hypothetical protein
MLEQRELAASGSVMGTGIESLDSEAPLNLSKHATAELKLMVDLDHYAVRDEAYRRSERLVKRLATAEKRVSDLHQELTECGLAIDAASKQATAEQKCDPYSVTRCSSLACAKTNALTAFSASSRSRGWKARSGITS